MIFSKVGQDLKSLKEEAHHTGACAKGLHWV